MSVSTHVYSAVLIGSPDVPLALRGGSITLDDTTAPHVSGTIDIAIPSTALLVALDPRQRKRVRVNVAATFTFGTQARTFDLGLRVRPVRHGAAIATLRVASDEAMLDDWAPLTTDVTPYQHQHSIRALTNYVLGSAITGAALAAGGPDPAIRAIIGSVNLVRNARARDNLTDWTSSNSISRVTSGGPTGSPTYVRTASAATGTLLVSVLEDGVPIREGVRYRVSVAQQADAGVMVAFDGLVFNAANTLLLDIIETAQAATGAWVRRSVEFVAPAGATKLRLRSFTTTAVTAGRSLDTSAWRVSEVTDDNTDTGYFDGDTTDTSDYDYSYSGATSVRTALIDRASDLLTWRAGVSALDFIAPILQALGLRLVCDETRTWTLRDDSYAAPGSLTIRHGVNLMDADDVLSRDDSEFFDAAVVVHKWTDLNGVQQERVDAFALVTPATQVRRFEKDTPYPGPGFAEYAVRRAQGRGRQLTVTTVADWQTRSEQPSEYTLLGAPVQLGKTSRITFDLDRDEMTVTSRTTDTIIGAIDLLPGVIDALVGTIDSL